MFSGTRLFPAAFRDIRDDLSAAESSGEVFWGISMNSELNLQRLSLNVQLTAELYGRSVTFKSFDAILDKWIQPFRDNQIKNPRHYPILNPGCV